MQMNKNKTKNAQEKKTVLTVLNSETMKMTVLAKCARMEEQLMLVSMVTTTGTMRESMIWRLE